MFDLIDKNKKDMGVVEGIRSGVIYFNDFSIYNDEDGETGVKWYYYKIPIEENDNIYDDFNNFEVQLIGEDYSGDVYNDCYAYLASNYNNIEDVIDNYDSWSNNNTYLRLDGNSNDIFHSSITDTKHCYILLKILIDEEIFEQKMNYLYFKHYLLKKYDNIFEQSPLIEQNIIISENDEYDFNYSMMPSYLEDTFDDEDGWRCLQIDAGENNELNRFLITTNFDGSGEVSIKVKYDNSDTPFDEVFLEDGYEVYLMGNDEDNFYSINGSYEYMYVFIKKEGEVNNLLINIDYIKGVNTYKGHLLCFHDYSGHRIFFRLLFPPDYNDYSSHELDEYPLAFYWSGGVAGGIYSCLEATSFTRKFFMSRAKWYEYKSFGITFPSTFKIPHIRDIENDYGRTLSEPDKKEEPNYDYGEGENACIATALLSLLKKISSYDFIDGNRFYLSGFSQGVVNWFDTINQFRNIWAGALLGSGLSVVNDKTYNVKILNEVEKELSYREVKRYKNIPMIISTGHFTDYCMHATISAVKELDRQDGNYHYQRYSSVGAILKKWVDDKDEKFILGDGNNIYFNFDNSYDGYDNGEIVLEDGVLYSLQTFMEKINIDFKSNNNIDFNIAEIVEWNKGDNNLKYNISVHQYIGPYSDYHSSGTLEINNEVVTANDIIGDDKWFIKDSSDNDIDNEWLSHPENIYPCFKNATWIGGHNPYHNNAGSIVNGKSQNLEWLFSQNLQSNNIQKDPYPSGDYWQEYLYSQDELKYYKTLHDNFEYYIDDDLNSNNNMMRFKIVGKYNNSKIVINNKEYNLAIENTNFVWDKNGNNEKYFYRKNNDNHTFLYYEHKKDIRDIEMYHNVDDINDFYIIWEGSYSDIEHYFIVSLNNDKYLELSRRCRRYNNIPTSNSSDIRTHIIKSVFPVDEKDTDLMQFYQSYYIKWEVHIGANYLKFFYGPYTYVNPTYFIYVTKDGLLFFRISKTVIGGSPGYHFIFSYDYKNYIGEYNDEEYRAIDEEEKNIGDKNIYIKWEDIDSNISQVSPSYRLSYILRNGFKINYNNSFLHYKGIQAKYIYINQSKGYNIENKNVKTKIKCNLNDWYDRTRITVDNKNYIITTTEDDRLIWDNMGEHRHIFNCVEGQQEEYKYFDKDNLNRIIVTWIERGSHIFSVEVINLYKKIVDYINELQKINESIIDTNNSVNNMLNSSNNLSVYTNEEVNFKNGIISSFEGLVQSSNFSEYNLINYVNGLQNYMINNYGDINEFLDNNDIQVKKYFADLSYKAGFSININNIEGDIS